MTKVRQAGSWRYLVRAKPEPFFSKAANAWVDLSTERAFPCDMKRLDHCEVLGTATVDDGHPMHLRTPWLVMYSRVCPATVSMWNRRGFEVAPLRMSLPAGDSEKGPVVWHARVGDAWYRVDFSTIQRPAG